jgi:putative hydrolase of HD superfamily
MSALGQNLPPHIQAAWQEYERQSDPEAQFVRQLDRLDMALQAITYASNGAEGMAEFLESAAKAIHDPTLVRMLDTLRERLEP